MNVYLLQRLRRKIYRKKSFREENTEPCIAGGDEHIELVQWGVYQKNKL